MHTPTTKAVVLSTILTFSSVVNAAAHLRPYHYQAKHNEARDSQVNGIAAGFAGIISELSSLFAGIGATPTTTSAVSASSAFATSKVQSLSNLSFTSAGKSTSSLVVSVSTAKTVSGTASIAGASSKASRSTVASASSGSKLSTTASASSGSKLSTTASASSGSKLSTAASASSGSKLSTAVSVSSRVATTQQASQAGSATTAPKVASSKSSLLQASSSTDAACPIRPRSSASGSSAKPSTKVASGSATSKTPSATGITTSATQSSTSVATTTASASSTATVAFTGPSVSISLGTVVGSALPGGIDQFLGIPYAEPPVGPLRLKPPVALTTSFGTLNATASPPSCPQFAQSLTGNYSLGGIQSLFDEFIFTPTVQQEDCLTMSVWRPNTTTSTSKLPVVYWIFGGGFEFGATAMYNGSEIVARSVAVGAPIIFVEVNYRLGGFGFLAGADLAAETSTNLGLRDQRLGLEWTADNIEAFGGDPTKVTLWGESAGAISSCYQLTVNGGNNTYKGQALFRGSIHNSGSFAPADNVTAPQAQAIYDQVVSEAGCSASTAAARLACLRSVDFDTLHNATNSVPGFGGYRSADLSYLPRPDTGDTFYATSAELAVAFGQWTETPFIIGDQQDEGTILAIVQNNITTNDDLVNYIASWFPNDPNAIADVQGLAALYPDNATAGQPDGSPYNTGSANNIYPQYKRLAAILGDIVFIITRRAFLNLGFAQGVPAWSYLSTYLQGLATFGTLHGSDLAYLFDPLFNNVGPTVSIHTYYISFVNYLDPNTLNTTQTSYDWPMWNSSTPAIADFTSGSPQDMNDTFRADVYQYLLTHLSGFKV